MTSAAGLSIDVEHKNTTQTLQIEPSDVTPVGAPQFGHRLVEIIRKPNGPIRLSAWMNEVTAFGFHLETLPADFSVWGHQFSRTKPDKYACYQLTSLYVAESIILATTNGLEMLRHGHLSFYVDTVPGRARQPQPGRAKDWLLIINMRLRPGRQHLLRLRDTVDQSYASAPGGNFARHTDLLEPTSEHGD